MPTYFAPLGTSEENLEVETKPLGYDLRFHGEKIKPTVQIGLPSRRFVDLQAEDGQTYHVDIKPHYLDLLPNLIVNGSEVTYRPPQPLWVIVVAVGSLVMVGLSFCVSGGFYTALLAMIPYLLAVSGSRNMHDKTVAAALALGSLVLVYGAWVAISAALISIMLRLNG